MLSVGSLFTGIGMLDYGLHLAGLTDHRWVCEQDEWRRERILAQRFPDAVRYADVRDAGAEWGRVDVIAGGFPCKGASTAGKREGFDHPETVLWREMARAVRELRPRYVLVENVSNLLALHDGAVWGEVLGDLAALGFDVVWDCLPAAAVGAPHLRDRVFAVAAHPDRMAGPPSEPCDRSGGEVARPREVERAERLHGHVGASADAERDAVREQPVAEPGSGGPAVAGRPDEAAADAARDAEGRPEAAAGAKRERARPRAGVAVGVGAQRVSSAGGGAAPANADGGRLAQQPQRYGERGPRLNGSCGNDPERRGVRVEWGEYEPAIRRWEAIHGPAPEPLLRGVDDRAAARVERSRLSALGDGVQVQVGYLAGRHIIELERARVTLQGQQPTGGT